VEEQLEVDTSLEVFCQNEVHYIVLATYGYRWDGTHLSRKGKQIFGNRLVSLV